jgi:multidrug efflux pump subunit AcrB
MKQFFRFFASNHLFSVLFSLMLILLGINAINNTPKDMFPKVDFGIVIIYTVYPNASPLDVELNITNKIEDKIDSIPGIKEFNSASVEGVSRIKITLDPDYPDEDEIVQKIRDEVANITDFPNDVNENPVIIKIDSSQFPFLEIGFSSEALAYDELREAARKFELKLKDIDGVSKLQKYGFLNREIKIFVDPKKINYYDLPITAVSEAILVNNIRRSIGTLKSNTAEKTIVSLAELKTLKSIEDIILRSTFEGRLIQIKDVATVSDEFEKPTQIGRMNGKSSILFTVFKSQNSDMIELSKAVKKLIKQENDTLNSVDIDYSRDMSKYLINRYSVVKNNGLIGLIFLLTVLGIFLNLRIGIWVGISIPVIVFGVFWLLTFFIPSIDIITLAAFIIVMGIIVDDGIIVSENILRRRELGDSPIDAAVNGISEVFNPVLTTILTTLVVFFPMFLMPGIIGKFIFVIPLVISLALLLSLFEVTIALPAHLVPSIAKIKPNKSSRSWFDSIKKKFKSFTKNILRFRYFIVIGFILLFLLSIYYTLNYKNFVLFPSNQAELIIAELEMPVGTSIEEVAKVVSHAEKQVLELPKSEFDAFSTRIGSKGRDDDNTTESSRFAKLQIFLTPYRHRTRDANEIAAELTKNTSLSTGKISYNVVGGGPPVGRPIEIRVSHFNNKKRATLADSIIKNLETVNGISDISRDDIKEKPRLQLIFNVEKLNRLGFTISQITQTVAIAFNGTNVTNVRLNNEDVSIRVIFNEESHYDIATLKNMPISNNQGRLIPLKNIVDFKEIPGVPNFYHVDGNRTTSIYANVDKTKTTPLSIYNTFSAQYKNSEDLNGGMISFGGESEETNKSFQDLFRTFLIALLGMYFILIILFKSLSQPLLVISCIPLGIIGVIFSFGIHNQDLGFFAMLGTIGLTGVLVNDSLVLVYRINKLKTLHPLMSMKEIVSTGTAERLRPILLTSLTTIAGVLPLAYGLGGSDPFISPMGLALGYGLMFSTPLILIYIPCMYMIHDDILNLFTSIKCKLQSSVK